MKTIMLSLALLASMGLTACADMGDGYGHHHDHDRGDHRDRDHHGDRDRHDDPH